MMDCQVWHRGHHCKKSFLWHWITAQLYVSNAAFVVYQHTLAHTRTFKKKKKDTHMWASDMQRNTPARSHITAREMKKPGREDSGISVPAYYSNIHICPKLFILALHAVVLMRVCIMTLIHQNLPFVCPVFICVCVCDLVLHTSPLPN